MENIKITINTGIEQLSALTPQKNMQENSQETSVKPAQIKEDTLQETDLINVTMYENNAATEETLENCMEQLVEAFDGRKNEDKETIKNILLDNSLNSYDILSIMTSYPGNNSALAQNITKTFSKNDKDMLLKTLISACTEVANGNDSVASGIAHNRMRTTEEFSKYLETEDTDNIHTSNMTTGIRG